MAISTKDIARGIYEGAKEKKGNHSLYYENVVKFLAKRKLLSKATDILKQLKKIVNQEEGIIEGKVSTSVRLGATERYQLIQQLKKRYGAKDVTLTEVVDEKLLGGIKVEVGDEVMDLTTKGKILKLQTYLMRSA